MGSSCFVSSGNNAIAIELEAHANLTVSIKLIINFHIIAMTYLRAL